MSNLKWVVATDRLPEEKGKFNSVIVRCTKEGHKFVSTGFTNYNETNPALYIECGNLSFLTVEGDGNFHSTVPVKYIEWLDESSPSSTPVSGLEETAMQQLLKSLYHQSNGCDQGNERYILSGIIDYAKKLLEVEQAQLSKAALSASLPSKMVEGWADVKPEPKECILLTADYIGKGKGWIYNSYLIDKVDGENDKGEDAWYWGLFNIEGEEYGPLEDLQAQKYKTINLPTLNIK